MTEEYYDNHFDYLIKNETELSYNKQKVRELLNTHLKNIPNGKLYKYRTCNRNNFSALKNNQVYMSEATMFKDIFDYTLNFDLAKEADNLKSWLIAHLSDFLYNALRKEFQSKNINFPLTKDLIDKIHKTYFTDEGKIIKNKFIAAINKEKPGQGLIIYKKIQTTLEMYSQKPSEDLEKLCLSLIETIKEENYSCRKKSLIYCLTEDKSNRPMWENYADNYTGYCVEYDFTELDDKSFRDIKNLIYLMPVMYVRERPILSLIPLLEIAMSGCFGNKTEMPIDYRIEINKQLLRKDFYYNYEKEWRFSIKNENNNLQPFPFISAIYMGKDITANNEKHLKIAAKRLGVPLFKQSLNFSGNDFNYNLIVS